ncbi:MAG: Crp/Fnr family transcriptional regulator [Desulfobacter postgatei]|jgi:CRP-like cAMP-binding protein|uniref:Crp/Fnr family transcriptional regulator n=1 Tax=Desulfobacter postgatei TaxID=2293 RepID=UPI0023F51CC6|nr:Crp/Fnr family transcriptional regulator [Desulfobacter postgatei]MDD4275017.1 Crp/Fnr family transcriptional regulator [Desulfobacter postgatei]
MTQDTDIGKQLKDTFDPYIKVDVKLWDAFATKLQLRQFKKNEIIKDAGQIEHYINFISTGSVGNFISGKGSETCISLSVANSFSSDYYSFLNQKPSIIYSRALETSNLFSLTHKDLAQLYSRSAMGVWIGKAIAEQLFIQRQQIQIDLLTLTAEERYLKLLSEKPEIFQWVSLKHIASFIGVTAESLSRLRKNIR